MLAGDASGFDSTYEGLKRAFLECPPERLEGFDSTYEGLKLGRDGIHEDSTMPFRQYL